MARVAEPDGNVIGAPASISFEKSSLDTQGGTTNDKNIAGIPASTSISTAAGTKEQNYSIMAITPLYNAATGDWSHQVPTEEENISLQEALAAQGQPHPPFVKSLLFRKDLQAQIGSLASLVRMELDAGQEDLISARWLAVAKNWCVISVRQIIMDETAVLKSMLVGDPSVRLVQTVSFLNSSCLYMSANALAVQFNQGVTRAKEFLTMEADCAVMIPVIIPEDTSLTVWDRNNPTQKLKLSLSHTTGFIMSGRTFIELESTKPPICLIFSMAANEEQVYSTYQVATQPCEAYPPHSQMSPRAVKHGVSRSKHGVSKRNRYRIDTKNIVWKTKEDAAKSLYYEFL